MLIKPHTNIYSLTNAYTHQSAYRRRHQRRQCCVLAIFECLLSVFVISAEMFKNNLLVMSESKNTHHNTKKCKFTYRYSKDNIHSYISCVSLRGLLMYSLLSGFNNSPELWLTRDIEIFFVRICARANVCICFVVFLCCARQFIYKRDVKNVHYD